MLQKGESSAQNLAFFKNDRILSCFKFNKHNDRGLHILQLTLYFSFLLLSIDFIYKTINNISYVDRSKCILNRSLPPVLFLIYENFVELGMLVLTGVFLSVLVEHYFSRYQKYYPQNPLTAFLYASVIPVCACSVIPLLYTMEDRLSYRTLVTFIVAAPILNPYIIVLSFTVLGWKYAILRIAGALVIAISAGYIIEFFTTRTSRLFSGQSLACKTNRCAVAGQGLLEKTRQIFVKILPWLLVAGIFSLSFELFMPKNIVAEHVLNSSIKGLAGFSLVGIPLYFCNGADVLFLRPLLCNGLGIGTAIAFSLTSTAICVSSFIMLLSFFGKKQTLILTLYIFLAAFGMGLVINNFVAYQ